MAATPAIALAVTSLGAANLIAWIEIASSLAVFRLPISGSPDVSVGGVSV
jgi:hypothetical protein